METSGEYADQVAADPCLTREQRFGALVADAPPDRTYGRREVLDREEMELG